MRASRAPNQPPIKTRRVWKNGTRVLQTKQGEDPRIPYQTLLGSDLVVKPVLGVEMAMLPPGFDKSVAPAYIGDDTVPHHQASVESYPLLVSRLPLV